MAVPRIRADYDQLGQVAQRFGAASDAAATTLKTLQQNMAVLEGGDWVGEGARAFYQEMSEAVLPTLKRLSNALQTAQEVTQAITREMKQAEDAAAAVLRANGAAGSGQGASTSASAGAAAGAANGGGFLSGAGDFFAGLEDEGKDMAGGLWHAATHPIDAVQGLWRGITHPSELWDAFKKPYVDAWQSGHPFQATGHGALFAVSLFGGDGNAEVADAIRSAKQANSANMAGRFTDAVDAAKTLGQATPGSQQASELANSIASQSTHIQDPATRAVLGQFEKSGGYIGEAQANGGVWYQSATGVFEAAGKQATWQTNQAFLQQMMGHGVDRLEFHGLDIDQELLNFDGQALDAVPARVKEIRYLVDQAGQNGYVQQGNSFVRVPGTSIPQMAGRAAVAGQAIDTSKDAQR